MMLIGSLAIIVFVVSCVGAVATGEWRLLLITAACYLILRGK